MRIISKKLSRLLMNVNGALCLINTVFSPNIFLPYVFTRINLLIEYLRKEPNTNFPTRGLMCRIEPELWKRCRNSQPNYRTIWFISFTVIWKPWSVKTSHWHHRGSGDALRGSLIGHHFFYWTTTCKISISSTENFAVNYNEPIENYTNLETIHPQTQHSSTESVSTIIQ